MTLPEEEYRTIPVGKNHVALVSVEDYERLSRFKWYPVNPCRRGVRTNTYATRHETVNGKRQTVLMHREVLGLERNDGVLADHVNANTLDNRRSNLRKASRSQNRMNSRSRSDAKVGLKGVTFFKYNKRAPYFSQIKKDGRQYWLGNWETAQEAHAAYVGASKVLFGEFARSE